MPTVVPFDYWSQQCVPYAVNMSDGTCTCRQFLLTNMPCKHMFAVLKHTGKPWSSLPSCVLENPWLNIDYLVSHSALNVWTGLEHFKWSGH